MKSDRSKFTTLKQICTFIPGYMVSKFSRIHGVDEKCRLFKWKTHYSPLGFMPGAV